MASANSLWQRAAWSAVLPLLQMDDGAHFDPCLVALAIELVSNGEVEEETRSKLARWVNKAMTCPSPDEEEAAQRLALWRDYSTANPWLHHPDTPEF